MQIILSRVSVAFCLSLAACLPPLEDPENHTFDFTQPEHQTRPSSPAPSDLILSPGEAARPVQVLELVEEPLCPAPPIDWTGPGQATCEEMRQVEHTISGIAGPVCDEFRAFCEGVLPSPCPPSAEIWLTDWPVDSPPFCVETGLFACGKNPAIRIQCCAPPF